jgi:adenylate cyclase
MYLVRGDAWRELGTSRRIVQGFLSRDPDRVVRVRVDGNRGWLTIKGRARDLERPEYSYLIPVDDARALLRLCLPHAIEKVRHEIVHEGATWEVDEFEGANEGLVLAEIELPAPDGADRAGIATWKAEIEASLPAWIGSEVSGEPRYHNSELSRRPFSDWSEQERARASGA